jgi:hypothetical protein
MLAAMAVAALRLLYRVLALLTQAAVVVEVLLPVELLLAEEAQVEQLARAHQAQQTPVAVAVVVVHSPEAQAAQALSLSLTLRHKCLPVVRLRHQAETQFIRSLRRGLLRQAIQFLIWL